MPTGNPPCNAHAHLGSRHPRAPGAGGGSWDRLQLRVTPAAPGLVPLLVTILRERGYAAGATNEIDRTLDCSMPGSSTSSSSEEWCLRTPRNTSESRFRPESRATFVQGYAGIPGLVAEQVRPPSATAQSDPAPQSHTTASPGRSASPSTDHRVSPSSPGGPPRSSPRNRKHLTSNSGRGTPHRRAHHRDPG